MKRIVILILIFFSINRILISQENNHNYKIQIIDSQSSEPLPFATILINKNPHRGVVTDLNGWTELTLLSEDSCILISYVGYQSQLINKSQLKGVVKLKAIDVVIGEVIVYARENPAHRIIKKAVANRNLNNPENIPEYGCKIYNKSAYERRKRKNKYNYHFI